MSPLDDVNMSKKRTEYADSRGKRKLSRHSLLSFPQEIIRTFAQLPKVFRKFDVDRFLGDKISRSMKWRYLRRMEDLGLIRHTTKKYYQKMYDSVSDWIEKDLILKVKKTEMRQQEE